MISKNLQPTFICLLIIFITLFMYMYVRIYVITPNQSELDQNARRHT